MAWAFALYGGSIALRRERRYRLGHVLAWSVVVYTLLAASGPDGYSRLRTPMMPIVCVYVSIATTHLLAKVSNSAVEVPEERRVSGARPPGETTTSSTRSDSHTEAPVTGG